MFRGIIQKCERDISTLVSQMLSITSEARREIWDRFLLTDLRKKKKKKTIGFRLLASRTI